MKLSKRAFTLIELLIAIAIIAILVAILVPNFRRARLRSQHVTCSTNCKNVATALEVYSVDHQGRYPSNSGLPGLNQLINGGNIGRIPTCPSAGQVTFVDFESSGTPDSFSFTCVGNNHGQLWGGLVGDNFPQYHSGAGLTDQPRP